MITCWDDPPPTPLLSEEFVYVGRCLNMEMYTTVILFFGETNREKERGFSLWEERMDDVSLVQVQVCLRRFDNNLLIRRRRA